MIMEVMIMKIIICEFVKLNCFILVLVVEEGKFILCIGEIVVCIVLVVFIVLFLVVFFLKFIWVVIYVFCLYNLGIFFVDGNKF